MRVLILHDEVSPDARADEQDTLAQAAAVSAALAELGHRCDRLAATLDLRALERDVAGRRPDLVFNLVESLAGRGRWIHFVPALLEGWGVPFTGSSSEAIFATSGKLLAKRILQASGLPTPPWIERTQLAAGGAVPAGTYIVKSVWEHASVGLDEDSVLETCDAGMLGAELERRLSSLGGEGFVESFVDGREFNLAVLAGPDGPQVLPPAEMLFEGYGPERRKVVGYRAKWAPESYEYNNTKRRYEYPPEDDALLAELCRLAVAAWELFALRGWARVDFRVDSAGRPWILEVNTNPCIAPDAGFAAALERAEIPYVRAIARILDDALPGGVSS